MAFTRLKSISLLCLISMISLKTFPHLFSIEERTCTILRRFYIIERLRSKVNFVTKLYKKWPNVSANSKRIPLDLPAFEFNNPCIAESWTHIQQTHSIQPLLEVWNHFTAYHYLDDSYFTEEFGQELFILTKIIIQDFGSLKWDKMTTPEQLFEDLNRHEIIDQITQRLYIINRLSRSNKLLINLEKNKQFSNHKNTIFELEKDCALINEYRHIKDPTFIKNCCIRLIAAFRVMSNSIDQEGGHSLEDATTEELLNNLDTVTIQLEELVTSPMPKPNSFWYVVLGALLGGCLGVAYATSFA